MLHDRNVKVTLWQKPPPLLSSTSSWLFALMKPVCCWDKQTQVYGLWHVRLITASRRAGQAICQCLIPLKRHHPVNLHQPQPAQVDSTCQQQRLHPPFPLHSTMLTLCFLSFFFSSSLSFLPSLAFSVAALTFQVVGELVPVFILNRLPVSHNILYVHTATHTFVQVGNHLLSHD